MSTVSVRCNHVDAGYYDDGDGNLKNLTLNSHEAMQVWVDQDEESTQISVTIAPLNIDSQH